jgi:hypothetical protein
VLPNPILNPKEEVTFRASRSISRTSKPPSLYLKRSNGSTAASISSISTTASDEQLGSSKTSPPPIPPFSKARDSNRQQQQSTSDPTADRELNQLSDLSATRERRLEPNSITRKPLPASKSPPLDRPLPLLPVPLSSPDQTLGRNHQVQEDDTTSRSPEADGTLSTIQDRDPPAGDMKKLKAFVQRKPVRSDSKNTLPPETNNAVNKENKPFYSSPSLGSYGSYITNGINGLMHPSKANLTDSTSVSPPTSKSTSVGASAAISPVDSTVQLPSDLNSTPQDSAAASQETIQAISQKTIRAALRDSTFEDELNGPSTPRPPPGTLPQPSPISMLEESPSRYALENEKGEKSEKSLHESNEKSARDRRSRVASGGFDQIKVSLFRVTMWN